MRLCDRWHAHVQRAKSGQAPNHPFYNEIRKYGPTAFLREPVETFDSIHPALIRERQLIADCPVEKRLNLSPGGLDDARFGGMCFWERLNASPDEKAAYCKKYQQRTEPKIGRIIVSSFLQRSSGARKMLEKHII